MPRFEANDGRSLFYRDSGGDGPAVLCLAGLSRNSRDFDALAEHLSDRYRVIRLDSRGRGLSEHAADPVAEYSVPVEARDALDLLEHLGLSGVGVVGTSRGGVLGFVMATARPDAVAALVLNDVGAVIEVRGLLRIMDYLGLAPKAQDFAALAEELREANAPAFAGLSSSDWERQARLWYDDDGGRPVLAYDPKLRLATSTAMDETVDQVDLWPLLDGIGPLPLLVIRGANSDILTAETVKEMLGWRPDIEHVEIADRGHAPFLDEPEALAAIDAFLGRRLPA